MPKCKVNNSDNHSLNNKKESKEDNVIVKEASIPSLKEKPHCHSFGIDLQICI